ncbi:O-antigen ligase family protein [Algibacter sp.]|nr:O-antigen ligase family protein [Algibacter sp.]
MKNFFGLAYKKNLIVFVIGLLTYIQIQVLGTFGIAELIALVAFPFIKPFKQIKHLRVKKLIIYLAFGIFGLIISNIYNETSFENSLKGVFFLVMFLIDLVFAYWMLKDNYRRILYFIAGVALSNILAFLFFPTSTLKSMIEISSGNIDELMSVWLVYFIQPTAIFIATILYYKGKRFASIFLIMIFAFYALFNSSRNIFLIWTIAAIILFIIGNVTFKNRQQKFAKIKKTLPIITIVLLISMIGITTVYENLAANGSLGENSKNKYLKQKYDSGDLGLLSGRIEFIIGLKAIYENPIFGYGSYPSDKTALRERTYNEYNVNINEGYDFNNEDRLSGHSHILNSHIYGGFLGIFFWIYAISVVIIFIIKHSFSDPKMIGFFTLMSLSWIWDFFFSPFAFRLQEAALLITIILAIKSSENIKKLNKIKIAKY